jgi:hypothetical protein
MHHPHPSQDCQYVMRMNRSMIRHDTIHMNMIWYDMTWCDMRWFWCDYWYIMGKINGAVTYIVVHVTIDKMLIYNTKNVISLKKPVYLSSPE